MNEPRRRLDPLALAVLGAAVVGIAAVTIYLLATVKWETKPADAAPQASRLRSAFEELVASLRSKVERETPQPKAKPAAPRPAAAAGPLIPEAGRAWRYAVQVEPPVWRDITLTYTTYTEGGALAVRTDFRHAGGATQFQLGRYAAGDPAHVNLRFPGFFMHAAYIYFPLAPGQRVAWSIPWQLPDGSYRTGRAKRYDGQMVGWESVTVPAGTYSAAHIEVRLDYVDGGKVHASARQSLWIAPQVRQVVKIVHEGRVPDEASTRIVAELAELR